MTVARRPRPGRDSSADSPAPLLARSAVPGIVWPGVPAPPGASLLALQFQLAQSEWWDAGRIRAQQRTQLRALLAHAVSEVPWYVARDEYREALAEGPSEAAFASLPVISRPQAQAAGETLHAASVPPAHGRLYPGRTTGSTGTPLDIRATDVTRLFNCALVLRDHLWQRRDLAGKLAVIRGRVEQGSHPSWLPGTGEALHTGPMVLLDIRRPLGEQLAWLRDQNPDYLLSPASNLEALAGQSLRDGVSLPALRETRCYGEMPGADLARVVGEAWGVPLHDLYSAEETGTLALQCPDTGTYHLQEEHTRVEVLDEHDRPCAVGEVGRVVVTPLHNFAMPLVRYAIGDHAEVGETCVCGRGLATLRRIMGRQRNMMRLPGGGQRWPRLPGRLWQPREVVRRLQVAQIALDRLEVRLVSSRRLSPAEGDALLAGLRDTLNWEHRLQIVYRDDLAVGTDLKFEDFVNELPDTERGTSTS